MCDRIGCMHLPNLELMDFSRRKFMQSSGAAALTMGVGSSLFVGAAHAAGELKSTHGTGFCNLNIFLAHALQIAKEDGVELKFVNTPTFAEQVTFLGIGQVDRRPDALHQLHRAVQCRRAGEDRRRRRHRRLRDRLAARPRHGRRS